MRAALAGAIAATVWGLQEPLDRRVFRSNYSDVRLVGGLHVQQEVCGELGHEEVIPVIQRAKPENERRRPMAAPFAPIRDA
jgi:hypothetical protein